MSAVRYVALAALVVWLGGTMNAFAGDRLPSWSLLTYVCGAIMSVALVVMKFVGPPPHAFFVRIAIVIALVAATVAADTLQHLRTWQPFAFALGLALLGWYARE